MGHDDGTHESNVIHQCSARVYRGTWSRGRNCARKATVYRENQWWCKQHDPEVAEERRTERQRKYRERQHSLRPVYAAYHMLDGLRKIADGRTADPALYAHRLLTKVGLRRWKRSEEDD